MEDLEELTLNDNRMKFHITRKINGIRKRSSNVSTVSIVKVAGTGKKQLKIGLEHFFETHGGLRKIIPAHTNKILIKPNLMMGEPWTTGITVNPYMVEFLVTLLKKEGLEVIVGEGAGWGCESADAFKKTGVADICDRLGIPLIDFKRGRGVHIPVPEGSLLKDVLVDEIVPECDFIFSLAKMKTHCETTVSLSMKNMKGLITEDRERLRFHLLDVNRCLIDLNRVFKPDFSIVEGIIALEGIGPLKPGKPKPLGIVAGGKDPVSVDAVCARIMGLNPADIRHLEYASLAGLGTIDKNEIEVTGESVEAVKPDLYECPPQKIEKLSPYENIKIINGNPCSNCIASLASYLHGYIDKKIIERATSNIEILIGGKARSSGTGREIAIGNCLKKYHGKLPFVSGCPPPSDAYLELIDRGLKGNFDIATVNSNCKVVFINKDNEV